MDMTRRALPKQAEPARLMGWQHLVLCLDVGDRGVYRCYLSNPDGHHVDGKQPPRFGESQATKYQEKIRALKGKSAHQVLEFCGLAIAIPQTEAPKARLVRISAAPVTEARPLRRLVFGANVERVRQHPKRCFTAKDGSIGTHTTNGACCHMVLPGSSWACAFECICDRRCGGCTTRTEIPFPALGWSIARHSQSNRIVGLGLAGCGAGPSQTHRKESTFDRPLIHLDAHTLPIHAQGQGRPPCDAILACGAAIWFRGSTAAVQPHV